MDRTRIEDGIKQLAKRLVGGSVNPEAYDIDEALDHLEDVRKYLVWSVRGSSSNQKAKKNIVVLGASGAGTSTVVSLLFRKGRVVVSHERYLPVLCAVPPLPGVNIRSGSVSTTLLPALNHVELNGRTFAVWDMPGSQDTRGPFVELVVHYIYQWMLENDLPLHFIIVTPPLHERSQQDKLEHTINSSLIRGDNAVLVYTKCGVDFNPESTAGLDIHETKRSIRSFYLPAPGGSDPDGHDYSRQYSGHVQNILAALGSLRSHEVTYSEILPPAAQLLLNQITTTCIKSVQDKLSACFLDLYNWNSFRETYEEVCETLNQLTGADVVDLQTAVNVLVRLVPTKSDFVRKDPEFICAWGRLSLVETLSRRSTHRSVADWLNPQAVHVLEEAKANLLELKRVVVTYSHREDLGETLIIAAFRLKLSEKLESIQEFVKKREQKIKSVATIPNVILVGYETLEVDVGIKMWGNLAFLGHLIEVTVPAEINLSATGKAECAQRHNNYPGKDGIHGTPGLPGGNLVVFCAELSDSDNKLSQTVSCGQEGGDAQNGGDGKHGVDSKYGEMDFKHAVQREIDHGLLIEDETATPQTLQGGLQLVKSKVYKSPLVGRTYGTPELQELKLKKSSEPGSKRTPAGSGGQGGAGGKGGKIRILNCEDTLWDARGLPGQKGSDGLSGEASRDGYGSPSFTAIVQQWYNRGGWFGTSTAEPTIKIKAEPKKPEDRPKVIKSKPIHGNGPPAVTNSGLSHTFVGSTYSRLQDLLEREIPHCDFSKLHAKVAYTEES
ncbi:unnamed protein product [Phytophthora lilii]|uniref:Unnamed protein product n=1 Tax=Phytophthora lilii TaxID=2077276 RepID=A0A9W6TH73_9STRA|nr:unnamed protein product [Phytophthora lilii]